MQRSLQIMILCYKSKNSYPFSTKVKSPKPRSYFNPTLRSFSFFPRNFPINQPAQNWTLNFYSLLPGAIFRYEIRGAPLELRLLKISISIGSQNQKLKSVQSSHCDKQKVQIFPAFKKTLKTAPINVQIYSFAKLTPAPTLPKTK